MRKTFTTKMQVNDALKLEMDIARICAGMADNGFPLDKRECVDQINILEDRIEWVDSAILPFIPPKPLQKGVTIQEPFKLSGDLKKVVKDWYPDDWHMVDGPFSRVEWEPINLGSNKQVNEWLLSNGWEPTEWNYKKDSKGKEITDERGRKIKTSPKLTEESLESLETFGQAGRLISYRRKCTHKRNQLQGFLRDCRPDGRVPSIVNTVGAATRRMTHQKIVNVPAPGKGKFWRTMRKVFWSGHKDYRVVGADASQIQVRGLGHYASLCCDDNTLINTLVEADQGLGDDVHTVNGRTAGVYRDDSKGIFYGYLFGAGIPKTAWQLGKSEKETKKIRDKFDEGLPFIRSLINYLTKFYRANGYITGLDGMPIYAESEHMLLVYLLQNFEVVVMKVALRNIIKEIEEKGIDAQLVTMQHDEYQFVCHKNHSKRLTKIIEKNFKKAGTITGSRCPILGEGEIGMTWYETH